MSKILILANNYNTLRIFRRELICEIVRRGHEVAVSIPNTDEENIKLLESYGCNILITNMERRGRNPLKDIVLYLNYRKLLNKEIPDKVITYTIKPNIYGALACKSKHITYYANVTGLGSAFQSKSFINKVVSLLYKISLNKAKKIFFENTGDRDRLVGDNIVRLDQTIVMPGAGVNLDEFDFVEYPSYDQEIRFLFIGRIMKEKGVDELFYAIKKLGYEYPMASFGILGWYEDEYKEVVESLQAEGLIQYYGFQLDVRPYIEKAHCIVLPSYHEGMSNTLLEGAAMGRPLITSNIHGCKEAVLNEESGYLVNAKDGEDLYQKLKKFIKSPYKEKVKMGKSSRTHIEKSFDKKKVVNMTIQELEI